jgi:hypothetical protein
VRSAVVEYAVFEESAVFAYCALAKYAKLADCFACSGSVIT